MNRMQSIEAPSLTLATVFVHRTRRWPLAVVYSNADWK